MGMSGDAIPVPEVEPEDPEVYICNCLVPFQSFLESQSWLHFSSRNNLSHYDRPADMLAAPVISICDVFCCSRFDRSVSSFFSCYRRLILSCWHAIIKANWKWNVRNKVLWTSWSTVAVLVNLNYRSFNLAQQVTSSMHASTPSIRVWLRVPTRRQNPCDRVLSPNWLTPMPTIILPPSLPNLIITFVFNHQYGRYIHTT